MSSSATRLTLTAQVEERPLKAPFAISGYEFRSLPILVVTAERGGAVGRGEAAGVYYLSDRPSSGAAQIEAVAPVVANGVTREDLRGLLPPGGARNALDCALWDLNATETGVPAWEAAGVGDPRPLVSTMTIGVDAPDAMARAATAYAGAKALKLKLSGDAEPDCARVHAVRAARPDVWIGVDANQGYRRETLPRLIPALVDARVELLEQPFARGREHDMEGLALPLPTAADESCLSLADVENLPGRFDVVNIKLDKCGGLTEGLMIAARARALGLRVMVGNMMGTSLAIAPGYVLGQVCDVVDLDGAVFLAEDRDPSVDYRDGLVRVPASAWGSGRR